MTRRTTALLLLLAIVAVGLRLWYSRVNGLLPQFSNADDGDYYRRALRLVMTGQYVDDSWLIRPPLHVWFFAAGLKLALLLGRPVTFGVTIVQTLQALLGGLMVPLGYGVVSRLVRDRRAGLLFALFWAIWFPFVDLASTLFSEPLYLFLFLLHLWLLLRYDDGGRRRNLALAGLVLGCAALTRSPALYGVVFALPWLWQRVRRTNRDDPQPVRRGRGIARVAAPFALLLVTTLVIVGPWTARNWVVYHRFIPVDTLGPINLWLDLGATGERGAKIEQLRALPQADRQAFATAQVVAILRQDPLRPLRPLWETFRAIDKAQFTEDFFVKRSSYNRALRPVAPLGLLSDLMWLLWSTAGLIGIIDSETDRAFKWVTGLWLAYSTATVLVFHVEPRYLLPIWLLLGMYGSWTLVRAHDWLLRRHGSRWRRSTALTVAVAWLALFFTYRDYPAILSRGLRRESAFVAAERAFRNNDYRGAEAGFRQALTADPGYIDATVALAATLGAEGRPAAGAALLDPHASPQSELMSGALLRGAGRTDQAAPLLAEGERITNLDAQQWALNALRPESRSAITLGTDLDLGYIHGFSLSEQAGDRSLRWLGDSGEVRLPLSQPLQLGDTVVLEVAAPVKLRGALQISINGAAPLQLQPQPQWRTYHLPVPPQAVGQSVLDLRLQAPVFIPLLRDPHNNDPRSLSVMLHRVALGSE